MAVFSQRPNFWSLVLAAIVALAGAWHQERRTDGQRLAVVNHKLKEAKAKRVALQDKLKEAEEQGVGKEAKSRKRITAKMRDLTKKLRGLSEQRKVLVESVKLAGGTPELPGTAPIIKLSKQIPANDPKYKEIAKEAKKYEGQMEAILEKKRPLVTQLYQAEMLRANAQGAEKEDLLEPNKELAERIKDLAFEQQDLHEAEEKLQEKFFDLELDTKL